MYRLTKIIILLGASLLGLNSVSTAIAAEPTPAMKIEAFVKLPSARDVQISPDGAHLSMIFKRDGEDMLAILETKTRKILNAFRVRGARKSVGRVDWVTNQRLVYSVMESYGWDKTLRDNGELIGVNIDGSNHKLIFGYQADEMQTGSLIKKKSAEYGNHDILDVLPEDDKHILIAFYPWKLTTKYWKYDPTAFPVIYRLNIFSGKKRKVTTLPIADGDAIVDNEGVVRFAIGVDKKNQLDLAYRKTGDDDWQKFGLDNFEGTNVVPVSFAQDNDSVYLAANVGSGTRALYLLNLNDRSVKKVFHNPEVNISQYVWDFNERQIVAVATELAQPEYHYLNKKDRKAKIHRALMKGFVNHDVIISSATKSGDTAIAFAYADINPGDYYLIDSNSLKADFLITQRDSIDPNLTAEMKPFAFKTRDGVDITGYLTKPRNASGKLPLVVLPHGGPHGVRDSWQYDWEVQLLASQGFAVLQVNFRGSYGFGKDFEKAGHGQWGGLMQDDITDATLEAIKNHGVDGERVCIYGSSYGGYAALMGSIREPDLYKCAVGAMGVYDLPMMFEEGDIAERDSGLAYLKQVLGSDKEDQKRRSPVYNVNKIKADLLLIHGAQDERAPIEQAESLKDALDDIDKSYEWLELSDEGHGYYDENNRLEVYTKIVDFLHKSIGNQSTMR